ncbi:hypothetical protein HN803_05630 [candidate division WWE3 bacterium]|jgi:hypothetical protein|nr:hypothetical protein [candidate division WWE3 bacterium]MBT7350241.1 hypothetical protein [candidate division WWE3 bacterium]
MRGLIEILKNKRGKPFLYVGVLVLFLIIFLLLPKTNPTDVSDSNKVPYKISTREDGEGTSFFSSGEDDSPIRYATPESGEGHASSYNMLAGVGIYEYENPPTRTTAIEAREKLFPHLPIYIENFKTSTGRETTINIFVVPGDRKDTARLEIYGVDLQNRDTNEATNPNVTVYKESFLEAKKQIESHGVVMTDLFWIFGSRDHMIVTTHRWIKVHGLL